MLKNAFTAAFQFPFYRFTEHISNRNVNKNNDNLCRTYLKFLLSLNLILVHNVVLTGDGWLTVLCYNMNILMSKRCQLICNIYCICSYHLHVLLFLKVSFFSVNQSH